MRLIFIFLFSLSLFANASDVLDINTLTVEEKVGQMLMVHFTGEEANEDAKRLLQQAHVGGFIYYNWANGLQNPAQVQNLSVGLQKLAKTISPNIPLLISIDQEGGVVTRLTSGFTVFPSNFAIAQTKHPKYAALSAFTTGQELKAVGINMNLAPVVDVSSNPLNPSVGVRSFSSSPKEVAHLGKLSLQGYQKAGIIATLKHFPGHGDVTVDSHIGLPIINKPLKDLEATEFFPFKKLLKNADAIMTAHLLIPSLDPQNCATLSSIILEDLLRKQWGYEGVIVSDSLVMQGVLDKCSSVNGAAIRAIQAGNDILILGGRALNDKGYAELKPDDIIRLHKHLVAAVNEGQISKERLDASIQRILKLKRKYQLFNEQYPDGKEIAKYVNTPAHQLLAKQIAKDSVKILKRNSTPLPFDMTQKNVAVVAPEVVNTASQNSSLMQLGKEIRSFFFKNLNPEEEELKKAQILTEWADVIIACSYNAWKNESQLRFLESLQKLGKPVFIIALRDPQDAEKLSAGSFVIATYSPTSYSIEAALNLIVK